ncbi:Asp-tRNA(Asn)/Glu-tRNA(Gln) amidotransferase GatCAB subunit C [Geothermobacter hydrogeniphilus]|uniref:Aspartyl/glutamyl-tRNA(Asn/Gln) amidotransferase subunit C n=1 Tax=Geothermobacter hydrogeniphilus TaxID=1969733 RepID=A0A2K2H7N3_9BACT|nr:Asp-tRNA(Asn)/Glu-tRNA(Gln) amidotransferase subunit GatC [Geothermobacter hydrogeniphilus]PNU19326.1 Asp-tRNA(Asn)/Glu-tRNA(Gln) amidotransferase GatCAB subunit C [Geothermobacter hydrogeniphilus]
MSMTREQVAHVARLARLDLADNELDRLAADMDAILSYVDKLNELDIDGIEPTAHAVPMENAFREDRVRPSIGTEKALVNAPAADDSCFLVPKVIE